MSIIQILQELNQPHYEEFMQVLSSVHINKKKYLKSDRYSLFLPSKKEVELLKQNINNGFFLKILKLLNKLMIKNDKLGQLNRNLIVLPVNNHCFIIDRYFDDNFQSSDDISNICNEILGETNDDIINEFTTTSSPLKEKERYIAECANDTVKLIKKITENRKNRNVKKLYMSFEDRNKLYSHLIDMINTDQSAAENEIKNYAIDYSENKKINKIIKSCSLYTKCTIFIQPLSILTNDSDYVLNIPKFYKISEEEKHDPPSDDDIIPISTIISKMENRTFILYQNIDINALIVEYREYFSDENLAYKILWVLISIFLLEKYVLNNVNNREGLIEHIKLLALKPSKRPYLDKILLLLNKILPELNYDIVPLGNFLYWAINDDNEIDQFIMDSDLDSENE